MQDNPTPMTCGFIERETQLIKIMSIVLDMVGKYNKLKDMPPGNGAEKKKMRSEILLDVSLISVIVRNIAGQVLC